MNADRNSLVELGLLPDAGEQWPLSHWLDRTHAKPGRDALTRLIAAPLGNVPDIQKRQLLLVHLATISERIQWTELQSLAGQVERYLASNYVYVPSSRVQRAMFSVRFGDTIRYIVQQLRSVDALLTVCDQINSHLWTLQGDATFAAVVSAFSASTEHPVRQRLRAAVNQNSEHVLAALDSAVRDPRVAPSQRHPAMQQVLQDVIAAIGQLDAFCSLALASASVDGVLPECLVSSHSSLQLVALQHPLLPGGTAIDMELEEKERVIFLTGPNMAGKSTLIRAIGIAAHSAHLGMKVAARVAQIPLYEQLLVSITAKDNLQSGESLYLAEIRRVRAIVNAVDSGKTVLALFDEVFRDTNIKDAVQATSLLVDGLARAPRGTFVIASHLANVGEVRQQQAGIACWCMDVDTSQSEPHFTFRVKRGVSDVHLGMVLLDREGIGPVLRRMAAG